MLNQNQVSDPRVRLAQIKAKMERETMERRELERQAAEADARERAEAEAKAERAALEQMRQARLTREAYEGLTEAEREQFSQMMDPAKLVGQALQQAREKFAADNEAQRQRELLEWRNNTPSGNNTAVTRHRALQEINTRAQERAQQFEQGIQERQLQAERYEDPLTRSIHSLPDEARGMLRDQLTNYQPKALEVIEQVKAENARNAYMDRQHELYTAFHRELKENGVRGLSWRHNTKQKYIAQGLDPNYSEPQR